MSRKGVPVSTLKPESLKNDSVAETKVDDERGVLLRNKDSVGAKV
ncbi:MAG: hypothetical protein Q4F84_02665 [Fibrobacter sp.]|nr:hypothetical protein [Fibrobacter sp.]